jgi:hypothetical protein
MAGGGLHDLYEQAAREVFGEGDYIIPLPRAATPALNVQPGDATRASSSDWLRRWMSIYSGRLAHLRLDQLVLPGTHDSATYHMVSPVAEPWAKCQELTIQGQLEAGTRALDLRVGLQASEPGNNQFLMVHEAWRTKINVWDVLQQVKALCASEPREFIILDFNRFTELDGHWTESSTLTSRS